MNERLQELVRKVKLSNPNLIWSWAELERFAELVRQDERIAMLQKITGRENQPSEFGTVTVEYMERQIAREREACAKFVEDEAFDDYLSGRACADAIRTRGSK